MAAEVSSRSSDDPGLLDEVAGLVEWPVPLPGRIADAFMDLPPEVMQVSMRVNQRYFASRTADGTAAPCVRLRRQHRAPRTAARRSSPATNACCAPALPMRGISGTSTARRSWKAACRRWTSVTFHAKLGTQGDRVRRLRRLAETIAPLRHAGPALAERAAELAKADLVTGMVGEFPELQGVMGRYYALHDDEDRACRRRDPRPLRAEGPVRSGAGRAGLIAVALADKLDQLACFFAIGERPTGAGDPYALRRAALGVIRIIRENGLRLNCAAGPAALEQHRSNGPRPLQR